MGFEVANERGELLGQFASNQGYGELIAVATTAYPFLHAFFRHGISEHISEVRSELESLAKAAKDQDVSSTARALYGLLDGQSLALITDGTGEEGDEDLLEKGGPNDNGSSSSISGSLDLRASGNSGDLAAKVDGSERALDQQRNAVQPAVSLASLVTKANHGDGVLLAFWPPPDVATRLAVEGGEPADELHITLAYFGKLSEFGVQRLPALEAALATFAANQPPITVTLGGLGRFPATPSSDSRDVAYLGVHSSKIQPFRQELVNLLDLVGCEPKKDHGYNPHITLKYLPPHAPHLLKTPEGVTVTFDRITLSLGSAKQEFPLTGVRQDHDIEIAGAVVKVDAVRHVVFGWFSIIEIDGRPVDDTQEDRIPIETLEAAAYDFVLYARKGGEMHKVDGAGVTRGVGRLIESCMMTHEKQQAMQQSLRDQGIEATVDLRCTAWWGGMRIDDEDTWARVTTGELRAWSMGGRGVRTPIS